ncbi:MAG: DUF1287 domain-containing protein, partial [Pyrinomonadaceae bacterium]
RARMVKSTGSVNSKQQDLRWLSVVSTCLIVVLGVSCQWRDKARRAETPPSLATPSSSSLVPLSADVSPQLKHLVESALEQTKITKGYDPSYIAINYPGGDVPLETGVCSDVIVRGFRKAGIDLQKEIHEDMKLAWSSYPRKWGLSNPDTNIDHRRVLNLMTYFDRKGKAVPITAIRGDYLPGDIVAWDLGNRVDHIGIVVNVWSADSHGYLIVHNIGTGARCQDVLLNWRIIGHYRYFQAGAH